MQDEILEIIKKYKVQFIRLQFTDIMGILKNVAIPIFEFEKAIKGELMFDGSSIEGFSRIEESDMYLKPDLSTFYILPWTINNITEARVICDVYNPDLTPFEGDPRYILKRQIDEAKKLGFEMMVGPEMEFFMFKRDENQRPTLYTQDKGGYFDLSPSDMGEIARRDIVITLSNMGFEIEAAHHEVAPGQHEIDFKYDCALKTADKVMTFKNVAKTIALMHNLHATFMPKPIANINGSGMHVHQSLHKNGKNAFYCEDKNNYNLSDTALHYIAGILHHAKAITAILNPLVNSYKRLIPGYEAPVYITWAQRNRSPLIRVPQKREEGTRIELRSPDPSANPYLAFAVMLAAGLDGIKRKLKAPKPADNINLYTLPLEQRLKMGISSLPASLGEALQYLSEDKLIIQTLGNHIYTNFMRNRLSEWNEYRKNVSMWEINKYFNIY